MATLRSLMGLDRAKARSRTVTWLTLAGGAILLACNGSPSDSGASDAGTAHNDGAGYLEDATSPIVDATVDGTPDTSVDAASPSSTCGKAILGPAGGTVTVQTGARIVVPEGALATATQLSLCAGGSPAGGALVGQALGQGVAAGPEGQTFLKPVDVTIPFDATRISPGANLDTVQIRMAPNGSSNFVALQSSVDLGQAVVHATTTHFTQFLSAQTANPIFITSSPSFPQGTVGVAYSQLFAAFGGAPPYSWSVPASSSLPPGLSLSAAGVLAGTPTVPNNFAFFVAVSDSANDEVELAVSLTVAPPNNPAPSLTQVMPSSVGQGNGDTVVSLSGTGFVPTAQAFWDGAALPTTYVGLSQLAASIPASDLLNAGTHQVSVINPALGGGTSNTILFTVTPAQIHPVPSIDSVAPMLLPISSADVQIAITGANFIAASSAVIDSQEIATNNKSSTQLLAVVPAAYLSSAGTLPIGVFSSGPGGGFSAATVALAVGTLNPLPTLVSLSPSSVNAGSGALTLSLSGNGFVQGSLAFFGSTTLATTYATNALVQAAVPAYLVANPGSAQIVLVNPTPGGGASAAVTFAIGAAVDGGPGSDAGDAGCTHGTQQCSGDGIETCGADGQWGSAVGCSGTTPFCANGACTSITPSCQAGGAGRSNCGAASESCCTTLYVAAGTYNRTYSNSGSGPTGEADRATVSAFRLDKYLVTVGRYREFVTAWNGGSGYDPPAGSGKHTHLNGGSGLNSTGGGYEPGWLASDDNNISPTNEYLACSATFQEWTSTPGSQENLPMNCVNWYEAYAFCIWDGGFLPSEAEWEYAAAGGSQEREYPWGATTPGTSSQYAICADGSNDCYYPSGPASCTNTSNIAPVGTATLGAGLWGQLDLAGEVWEWNLDAHAFSYVNPCTDCTNLTDPTGSGRVIRGGAFNRPLTLPPARLYLPPENHMFDTGFRCARSP